MNFFAHILGVSLCTYSLISSPSGNYGHPSELPWESATFAAHSKELLGARAPAGHGTIHPGQSDEGEDFAAQLAARHLYDLVESRLPQAWKSKGNTIAATLVNESRRYEMDPLFVSAIIMTESTFRPQVVGAHGEIGLMQIKPSTAEWIAKKYDIEWEEAQKLKNPHYNIKIGTAYLDYLRRKFSRNSNQYIAAYNMGPGRVRSLAKNGKVKSVYTRKAMGFYRDLHKDLHQHLNTLAKSQEPQNSGLVSL